MGFFYYSAYIGNDYMTVFLTNKIILLIIITAYINSKPNNDIEMIIVITRTKWYIM